MNIYNQEITSEDVRAYLTFIEPAGKKKIKIKMRTVKGGKLPDFDIKIDMPKNKLKYIYELRGNINLARMEAKSLIKVVINKIDSFLSQFINMTPKGKVDMKNKIKKMICSDLKIYCNSDSNYKKQILSQYDTSYLKTIIQV